MEYNFFKKILAPFRKFKENRSLTVTDQKSSLIIHNSSLILCLLLFPSVRAEDNSDGCAGVPPANSRTLVPSVRAEDNSEAQAQLAKKNIEDLGADNYFERLQARERLMQLGRQAIEPLEAAAQSEDTEIRLRAIEILIALRGRGFLGIGLSENNPNAKLKPETEIESHPVSVNLILESKNFSQHGVKRLFPSETNEFQVGDRIISVNGRPIRGIKDLLREVIIIGPARVANLLIERDGKVLRLTPLLTRNPMPVLSGGQYQPDPPPPVDLEKDIKVKR